MSWDAKGHRRYFYRWDPARAGKVYVGRGPAADQAAQEVAQRRQARIAAHEALERDRARTAAAEQALHDFTDQVLVLLRATLTAAGYYTHKGEWRPRHGRQRNANPTR